MPYPLLPQFCGGKDGAFTYFTGVFCALAPIHSQRREPFALMDELVHFTGAITKNPVADPDGWQIRRLPGGVVPYPIGAYIEPLGDLFSRE